MEPTKIIFVPSDKEWTDRFRRLQAMYDTRDDKVRQPSKASLFLVISLLAVMLCGTVVTLSHIL